MEKNSCEPRLQRLGSGNSNASLRVNLMQRPRIKVILILILSCILFLSCKSSFKPEDVFATEEKDNSAFSVRIIAFRERRAFAQALGGAYYAFETKNKNEGKWKRFL